ncbi:DUF421 domain-containing protein [Metabacillus herbersteinensis]|uniref:DUF421 domain-containing protein n=1 Tax=Metabacillus herbersteinensis TaxID=283816 RepID=A0ABV6GIM3_9BACI
MNVAFKAVIMIFVGVFLLRIAGRKSISQMTVAQTVIMISIGSIIIQPFIENNVWKTILAAAIFIGFLVLMEFLQVRFNFFEKLLTGKAVVVIENGVVNENNLKKLRFTVDQLEMRLRQNGITDFKKIKLATLEPNGQIGYEWMPSAQPVTVGDLERIFEKLGYHIPQQASSAPNLFDEVKNKGHEKDVPKHLK